MVEIIFQNRTDAIKCYDHLWKCLMHVPDMKNILLLEDRYRVKIQDSLISENVLEYVKVGFYQFITTVKRDDWFHEILSNQFYYKDTEEQQQILEILYSILEGQREDLSVFIKDTNEDPKIKEAIEQIFHDQVSFSFDSFVKFRLRSYLQYLERYVEVSIDEYKMEQEYQMFVQMLRDFLVGRAPKTDILYLLLDEEITFYNKQFDEIKRSELTKMIDRKLLVNHPIYVDSATIAPLLSLAPITIYIYTKDKDAPLVRTIQNIFEERVIIKPYQSLRDLEQFGGYIDGKSEQHGS
ncbi:sporulation protein YtxC [Neobacillus dielmonensis]|uniref:sporulation protein YtxC n=1 Tax=Neobacillus dielmonensis TaxID=1347369 RepID=UPI0005A61F7B|nr:sporulation protein YtxC [Neobacillus dielmonensis]